MINHIDIKGYKSFDEESLPIAPLTVVTGKNSTGKSSLLQAILLSQVRGAAKIYYNDFINTDFSSIRNRYTRAELVEVQLNIDDNRIIEYQRSEDKWQVRFNMDEFPNLEERLFYLSANRIGAQNSAQIYQDIVCGPMGEALFGTYEAEKSKRLDDNLIRDFNSFTLSAQVNHWLSYILDIPLELNSEKRMSTTVEVRYNADDIKDILPQMLGAGVSYLAKILILCLRSKKDDIIMIENPEIHLYPSAQCRLAEFLSFIVASGRQLIIETHSNDLITKFRHEVYKGKLLPQAVEVLYKDGITTPFKLLKIDRNGQFSEPFPEGFFDSSLSDLLDME